MMKRKEAKVERASRSFLFSKGSKASETLTLLFGLCRHVLLTLLFAVGATAAGRAPKAPCNVVLVVSDDHGIEALGCYGNPVIQTPNLDALAADGTRFTQAFCNASSCSPSRSAILTGLQNHANGMYGLAHDINHFSCLDGTVTLPARMKEAGFRTGRVGKMHYAPESLFPFDFGFPHDEFLRDDVRMSKACKPFIEENGPFFLYWCSWNPHRGAGPLQSNPLKPDRFGNPLESYPGDTEQVYDESKVIVPSFMSDMPEVRAELAQYYQSISRMDRGVGELIKILKEAGKYDNTLIIYVSDNGSAFPGAKTTLYEPGMNLPCIVKAPGRDVGVVNDALVSWVDITPTILDFTGVFAEENAFHGQSFKQCVGQPTTPNGWHSEIFASHSFHALTGYYPMRVIRSAQYKFIWNIAWPLTYPTGRDVWKGATWKAIEREQPEYFGLRRMQDYMHRPEFELYDLAADPNELTNLADKPEYAAQVSDFIEKIKTLQEQTSDPWLHKWIYK